MGKVSEARQPRPARQKNLGDIVFDRLIESIKSGAYAQDERLPPEHALAAEFQVSRPIIREALQRLKDQGLIHSRRGSGNFVQNQGLRKPLGFTQVENAADLEKCYEFRLSIEPQAAAAAAERHEAAGLAEIAAALDLMRVATGRQIHLEDADFSFHLAIARASGNPYFATAMEALKEHIAVGMKSHGQSLRGSDNGLAEVYCEHKAICEAIGDRQIELARDLMVAHLECSRDRMMWQSED